MKRFLFVLSLFEVLTYIESLSTFGYIYVIPTSHNLTEQRFKYQAADFGDPITQESLLRGVLWLAVPLNACTPVEKPQRRGFANPVNNFLLIEESGSRKCPYAMQVLHAQNAGYNATIVYNKYDNSLITMSGDGPIIPSVYVSKHSGQQLKHCLHDTDATIEFYPFEEFPLKLYVIPFAVVVGICFFFMLIFSIGRLVRFHMRQRRSRLSPANLKKIPKKKFKKGDDYDSCAICIEDYEENDNIRILPCNHAYHCKCVDPWLTSGKKLCPVCKRAVEPEKKTRKKKTKEIRQIHDGASTNPNATESGTIVDNHGHHDSDHVDENTPLLSSQSSNVSTSCSINV